MSMGFSLDLSCLCTTEAQPKEKLEEGMPSGDWCSDLAHIVDLQMFQQININPSQIKFEGRFVHLGIHLKPCSPDPGDRPKKSSLRYCQKSLCLSSIPSQLWTWIVWPKQRPLQWSNRALSRERLIHLPTGDLLKERLVHLDTKSSCLRTLKQILS